MANDFLAFAGAGGANVLTQAAYVALAARTAGFSAGTARSQELNKVWRQSSIIAAAVAQAVSDITGQDAIDNGTTATLTAMFKAAFAAASNAVVGSSSNLKASVGAPTTSTNITAAVIIVNASLGGNTYSLPNFNKPINLATVGVGGMDVGLAPVSGYVAVYAIYNPTTGVSGLLATDATAAAQPEVYGGANMPAGFTASSLVSVWGTNASRQFVIGSQTGREITMATNSTFTTSTVQASLTSFSIAAVVPKNAVACRGDMTAGSSALGAGATTVYSGASIEIGRAALGMTTATAGATQVASFPNIPILTAQTLYYRASVSAGTLVLVLGLCAYTF